MSELQPYASRKRSAEDAVALIPRGKHIFIGSGAANPESLVMAMVEQAHRFADNTIVHLLTLAPAPYVDAAFQESFRHNAFFIGGNVREAVHEGRADYTPVFLSQVPSLIRSRRLPVDVALIQVSPPDRFGYVNLGSSVDIIPAALDTASLIIAEVNDRMPVVQGAGWLRMERIHAWVGVSRPLPELTPEPLDDVALEIGRNVASLVDDRCTIQVGIGQIPDATLKALAGKRDLGVWTEMFSDGMIDLVEAGVVTGRYKRTHKNKVSASFAFGTKRLYEYINDNPGFTFHPSDYVNDPSRIGKQHRMVAINSALQVDLTGQVCADSIGTRFYSGIGGQVDFIRGASMCPGGKPVIAIRSTAKGGQLSRIVAMLEPGAGVVTSRGDVRYLVTEYGIADLQGRSIRERAMALIAVSHPDFRAELLQSAKARHYVFADQVAPRATFPAHQEQAFVTSKGQRLLLRPIQVTDEPKMSDLFYSLSDQTVYRRWQRVLNRMPHKDLQYYMDVDYGKNLAVVAETVGDPSSLGTDQESIIVAVGRYHTDPETNLADVAFLVRDAWQGQGLGTALLALLTEYARAHAVDGFTAEVLSENRAMMHVFHKSGLPIESHLSEGVYSLKMRFPAGGGERRPEPALPTPPQSTGRSGTG